MTFSDLGIITGKLSSSRPIGGKSKRIFDAGAALALLIFFTPLMITIAVIIKITDRGPIIYRHERIGYCGRTFGCLKFRSMVVDAESQLQELVGGDAENTTEWLETRKLRNDPRITAVGVHIRKWSLDELPQLFNVLMGEMSLVGPRPVTDEEIEKYSSDASSYLRARPGITGLWQVSGRSDLAYVERVRLDVYYVKNWSAMLDAKLLLKTIGVVLAAEGSH